MYARWSELNSSAKVFLDPIIKEWKRLLGKSPIREQTIHQFLERHAHLFLWGGFGFATAVSKLRFGAEHIADFVIVYDNWSDGIRYKLVEIERPDTPPFISGGVASARLSRAIQQVLSWKTWLADHTTEARRLFPSYRYRSSDLSAAFDFEIIIGTREDSSQWLKQRRALSDALGVRIRSFDYLTDVIACPRFEDFSSVGDETHYDLTSRNNLACPFVYALSDPEWREILRLGGANDHFMYQYDKLLLEIRRENRFASRFRKDHLFS